MVNRDTLPSLHMRAPASPGHDSLVAVGGVV